MLGGLAVNYIFDFTFTHLCIGNPWCAYYYGFFLRWVLLHNHSWFQILFLAQVGVELKILLAQLPSPVVIVVYYHTRLLTVSPPSMDFPGCNPFTREGVSVLHGTLEIL